MNDLAELERRLAEATGPDEEIDWMLAGKPRFVVDGEPNFNVRRCTASLDAAIDLVEEKLPGWGVRVEICSKKEWESKSHEAHLVRPENVWVSLSAYALTPALAVCLVLIRALREMEGADA